MMQSEDLWFNAPGCGMDPPQECCTSYGPVQAGGFRPCTSHGCPPNCVSELYNIYDRVDNRGRGRADAGRGTRSTTTTSGKSMMNRRFSNAAGVRGGGRPTPQTHHVVSDGKKCRTCGVCHPNRCWSCDGGGYECDSANNFIQTRDFVAKRAGRTVSDVSTPDSDRFENASGCGLWMCEQ